MSGTPAKAIALGVVLQLSAAALWAQTPELEGLFPAQPTGFVTDAAGVVDHGSATKMESLIERLRAATGVEIAVVTLPTIGDREASEVALAIGRKWGVGARAEIGDSTRNAGVVLLLVPRQGGRAGSGHIRVEVGQGLEGIITDAAAGRVRDLMTPQLANEEYGPALLRGVEAITALVAQGFGVSDTALTGVRPRGPPSGGGQQLLRFAPILLFVVFFLLATRGGGRRRRRNVYWGGPWIGGGWGGGGGFGGGGFGGGGFGGFGGGGGFSGGGAGGRF